MTRPSEISTYYDARILAYLNTKYSETESQWEDGERYATVYRASASSIAFRIALPMDGDGNILVDSTAPASGGRTDHDLRVSSSLYRLKKAGLADYQAHGGQQGWASTTALAKLGDFHRSEAADEVVEVGGRAGIMAQVMAALAVADDYTLLAFARDAERVNRSQA